MPPYNSIVCRCAILINFLNCFSVVCNAYIIYVRLKHTAYALPKLIWYIYASGKIPLSYCFPRRTAYIKLAVMPAACKSAVFYTYNSGNRILVQPARSIYIRSAFQLNIYAEARISKPIVAVYIIFKTVAGFNGIFFI